MTRVVDPLVALLRERREGLGWSQQQLGERMGVGNTMISELERGWVSPTLWTLRRWTDALDVDLVIVAPDPVPDVDEVAVERACRGQSVALNQLEREIVVAKLTDRGLSAKQIGAQLLVSSRTVVRDRERAARAQGSAQAVDDVGMVA